MSEPGATRQHPPTVQELHDLPVHEAVLLLETDRKAGLSESEAARRLARVGPNSLPRAPRKSAFARFAAQFNHPLIYILLGAGAVTMAIGQLVDAGVIFGVVLVNTVAGFIQEGRAEQALEALAAMVSPEATVIRGGARRRIDSVEVVPGDLIALTVGDAIPADVRLTSIRELEADESALTGSRCRRPRLRPCCRPRPRSRTGRTWPSPGP